MKRTKLLLSMLVVVVLMVGVAALTQASAATVVSGKCGDNLTWSLDDKGTFYINGSGTIDKNVGTMLADAFKPGGPYHTAQEIKSVVIGRGITGIGQQTFIKLGITRVVIPDTVLSIGNSAFSECDQLEELSLPNSVKTIGTYAFYSCTSLQRITIGNSVETIGSYAFYGCIALKAIIVPDSVKNLGEGAFAACVKLSNVVLGTGLETISSGLFSSCSELNNVVIPDGVTVIESWAFHFCGKLTSVELPDSLTTIQQGAFCYCDLTKLKIPNNVTRVEQSAFSYNDRIEELTMPVTLSIVTPNLKIEHLIKIHLTPGVDGIMALGIGGCSDLEELIMDEGIKTISQYAFAGCKKLTSVEIPSSVTIIDDAAFSDCTNMSSITIPKNVISIGAYAFRNCDNLASVTIPESVTRIGAQAFSGCLNLNSVFISDIAKWCQIKFEGNPLSYASQLYCNQKLITDLIIPENVTSINDGAFASFSGITSVVISDSVSSIGQKAFYGCSNLNKVIMPNTVLSVGSNAFYNCSQLSNVYYAGTQIQWKQISISSGNTCLTKATIHYAPSDPSTPHTHIFGNYISDGNATCQTDGTKTATCIYCSATDTIADPGSKTDHIDRNGDKKCDFCGAAVSSGEEPSGYDTCPDGVYRGVLQKVHTVFPAPGETAIIYVNAITVDGKTYEAKDKTVIPVSADSHIGEEILYTMQNNKLTQLLFTQDEEEEISNLNNLKTHAALDNVAVYYKGSKYDHETINIDLILTNAISAKNPENASDHLNDPDYQIAVSIVTATVDNTELASFGNKASISVGTNWPKTLNLTQKLQTGDFVLNINTKHKMDRSVQQETIRVILGVDYVLRGETKHIPVKVNIPVINQNYVAPKPKLPEDNPAKKKYVKELKEAAIELDKIYNQINLDLLVMRGFLTKDQAQAIGMELLTTIALTAIPPQSLREAFAKKIEDKILDKVIGTHSFAVGQFSKTIHYTVALETKDYGEIQLEIEVGITKWNYNSNEISSFDTMRYTVTGGQNIPSAYRSGMAGLAVTANPENLSKAAQSALEGAIKNVYNKAYGDDLNSVADLMFNQTVKDIIAYSKYKKTSEAFYAAITAPAKKFVSKCPVDMYVYDTAGNLVASIVDSKVEASTDNARAEVDGDTKSVMLFDSSYRIDLIARGTGIMDIVIDEYANSDDLLRTVTKRNISVGNNSLYKVDCSNAVMTDPYSIDYIYSGSCLYSLFPDTDQHYVHTHEVESWATESTPTCSTYGVSTGVCTVCGVTVAEYEAPLPHTYTATITTEPTCTYDGETTYTCSVCGDTYTEPIPATGEHEDVDNDGYCDACEEMMTGGQHCKYCGKIHGGLFGWLVKFFHSIFAIFKR